MAFSPNTSTYKTEEKHRSNKNYRPALILLSSLFFMWGFITCLNDILIPHLKALFEMDYAQTMLIQFTFFGAYFLMSLPSGWLVGRIGYKQGIVVGLAVTGFGAFLFYPASIIATYNMFLLALFILASGITLLQVSANPYVAELGSPETASGRLNLTQALNSFGTTVAPIFGSFLILTGENSTAAERAESVQLPYIGIAVVLILIAVVFLLVKLPKIKYTKTDISGSAWHNPHLVFGAIAIFVYVGAEVSIGSFLINFLGEENIAGFTEKEAAKYITLYWGGAMIGRFFGSVSLSDMMNRNRWMLNILVAAFSFFLAWYLTEEMSLALIFMIFVIINIAAFQIGKNKAARTLAVFAGVNTLLVTVTVLTSGQFAMWTILAVGLFNSIMFPTIFTLGIAGLGKHTSQGSGILVMAIVGGALIPLLMGFLADSFGIHHSFIITVICYAYIFFYGIKGYKTNSNNNL